jgi:hypothetical protein
MNILPNLKIIIKTKGFKAMILFPTNEPDFIGWIAIGRNSKHLFRHYYHEESNTGVALSPPLTDRDYDLVYQHYEVDIPELGQDLMATNIDWGNNQQS